IKSAFLVDLNFSIEEIKQIIEELPHVIRSADTEEELKKEFQLLKAAGAKICIRRTGNQEVIYPSSSNEFESYESSSPTDNELTFEATSLEPDKEDGTTFEIELDIPDISDLSSQSKEKESKVYEINYERSKEYSNTIKSEQNTDKEEGVVVKAKCDLKKDDTPLFSFEEISKALEESQNVLDQKSQLRDSVVAPEDDDEFDLSFDNDAPVIPSTTAVKPTQTEKVETKYASDNQMTFDEELTDSSSESEALPEIEVEDDTEESSSSTNEVSLNTEGTPQQETSDNSSTKSKSQTITKLSDISARAKEAATERASLSQSYEVKCENIENRSRPSRFRTLLREIVAPIVIIGLILGVANWYYFFVLKSPAVQLKENAFKTTVTPSQQPSLVSTQSSGIPTPVEQILRGKSEFPDRSISIQYVVDQKRIKAFKIEITTTPPPPLSPEQIVRQEKRKPWLKKIIIDDLPLSYDTEHTFSAKGAVKAYVENDKVAFRVIATATLNGTWNETFDSITSNISVRYNNDNESPQSTEIIQRLADGSLSFLLNTSVIAMK
ncbi:MAG: hypothetical protein GYA55_06315, partial [SAR324 cluster bacterium]|nr:hypothetical protein [SAR324 cluster bacterium]